MLHLYANVRAININTRSLLMILSACVNLEKVCKGYKVFRTELWNLLW